MSKTPIEQLCDRLTYSDGKLYWRDGQRAGKEWAGNANGSPYHKGMYAKKNLRRSRVVWVWHNGAIPEGMHIDHDDRDPGNDRIGNLILKTPTQNARNRTTRPNRTTGAVGIQFSYTTGKFTVRIGNEYVGTYDTFTRASIARRAAEIRLGYGKVETEMEEIVNEVTTWFQRLISWARSVK